MALYATQNSAGAERRAKAKRRLQVAHAILAALGQKGGPAGGKPNLGAGSAAAAPRPAEDQAALARRKYRQEVLGIKNVNQATPEQIAAARTGSGLGAAMAMPTHELMLTKLARQRAEAARGGGGSADRREQRLALGELAAGRRRRQRRGLVATGG